MDKLEIMKRVLDFQLEMCELREDQRNISMEQVNDLLLAKRSESPQMNIGLCISKEDISITDEVTGLSVMAKLKKFNNNYAIMVDMSKIANVDILSNFIVDMNTQQQGSKEDHKIAIVMANLAEKKDMKIFNKEFVVPSLKDALDNFLIVA